MRINSKTKYWRLQPVEKFLTPESVQELKSAAEKEFGSMYDLTFADFWNCCNDDFSILGDMSNPTVLQVYWAKRFVDFLDEFGKTMKKLEMQPTEDERAAANGLIKLTWGECVLVFLRDYFGLKSFKEAEKITIGELIIAKRAQYNQDKFRRNFARIQSAKIQRK